jgi:peptidyl-tRNA hydrolase, PTH1 family
MRLIVGLGNPGREYVGTRHNVGFETVEAFAVRLGWINKPDQFQKLARAKFEGLTLDGRMQTTAGEEKLLVLEPMTYMNVSGRSVRAAMDFYQLTPPDVMIVLDDLALPAGRLRLRASGSSGGHNGLKDIQRVLGTSDYPRLRIGIDPKPPFVPQADYVLQRFAPEQRKLVDDAIARACGAIATWIDKGIETAMSQFNSAETNEKNKRD